VGAGQPDPHINGKIYRKEKRHELRSAPKVTKGIRLTDVCETQQKAKRSNFFFEIMSSARISEFPIKLGLGRQKVLAEKE
jgi:hypothetical protein